MYPSTNNNGNPSFASTDQPRTFSSLYNYNDDTTRSKPPQEHYYPPSSSSFQLLSPHLEDEEIFSELLQQHLFSIDDSYHNTKIAAHEQYSTHDSSTNLQSAMGKCIKENEKIVMEDGDDDDHFNIHVEPTNSSIRMRTSKKDRHSKINTARGPRDRRMRLSLGVAKKFFKLQDMLGFDKASKTVEWLLTKSKTEWEVLSGNINDQSMVKTGDEQVTPKYKAKSSSSSNSKKKKKIAKGVRRSARLHRPLAKETRERARARARERTMEKSNKLGCGGGNQNPELRPRLDQAMDQDVNRLGSWNINQPEQPSSHFQLKQGIIGDNPSLMTGNWSPSFLFNHQHAGLPHEHQSNDFQILGNLWEGNN